MACNYKIGKLKDHIYLIEDLVYKVIDYKVNIISGKVYKLFADQVIFNEQESYSGRFQFNTTVEVTLNRIYDDTFIKNNKFKLIVEDLNGIQYLVSPEFEASYTSDFTINGESIIYKLTFSTQSNIPTRIVYSKIVGETIDKECKYNMFGIDNLYIGHNNNYKKVDFLACEYNKTYDGYFNNIKVTFTIDVEDNDWHYDLIKFPDNRWDVKIESNQQTIIETLLFPQYARQSSETNTIFSIVLSKREGGTLVGKSQSQTQSRWLPTDEFICDGFTKYVKEVKQIYVNGEWQNTEEVRKGLFVESNSEYCGYEVGIRYRWVDLGIDTDYICVGTNKHIKQQQQISRDDGQTWENTDTYRAGDLYQANSLDCGYEFIEWLPVDGQYICEEYDPSVSWVLVDEYICKPIVI